MVDPSHLQVAPEGVVDGIRITSLMGASAEKQQTLSGGHWEVNKSSELTSLIPPLWALAMSAAILVCSYHVLRMAQMLWNWNHTYRGSKHPWHVHPQSGVDNGSDKHAGDCR